MDAIYLDHSSTTPVLPAVVEAMGPFWGETFGNPASSHQYGRRARQALETARETVAALLGAEPTEVIFTSGATEANNLALLGITQHLSPVDLRIITSEIEHPSVLEPIRQLAKYGVRVDYLPVDEQGLVRADGLNQHSTETNTLLAVMLANNETGAIQPISRTHHSPLTTHLFHCDAVQAVGKIPVNLHQLGVTTLSLSAHKFNGPRGIGALLVRKGTRLHPLFWGGHQQKGLRPGTEPVALAVGLAKALELAHAEMTTRTQHIKNLRQQFLQYLEEHAAPVVLNGPREQGLPHILNLSFPGCRADALLMKLDLAGVACSTGSACSSGSLLPSPVLKTMGCPPAILQSAMRFSLSHLQTEEEIAQGATRIAEAVVQLRRQAD